MPHSSNWQPIHVLCRRQVEYLAPGEVLHYDRGMTDQDQESPAAERKYQITEQECQAMLDKNNGVTDTP